jgi:hypothetical protein
VKIVFVAPAKRELMIASRFYERRVAGLGDRFLDEVTRSLSLIRRHPRAWPVKFPGAVRQMRLRRFPFALMYRCSDELIVIFAVAHLRRRRAYWQRRMQRDID